MIDSRHLGKSLLMLMLISLSLGQVFPLAAREPTSPKSTYPFYGKLLRISSSAIELESSSKKSPRRLSVSSETHSHEMASHQSHLRLGSGSGLEGAPGRTLFGVKPP